MRRAALALLLAAPLACFDSVDPRLWLAAALFVTRDTVPDAVAIDTVAVPRDALEALRDAGFRIDRAGAIRVGFGQPRPAGRRLHDIEVRIERSGTPTVWVLTIECRSRHCLVTDTVRR